MADLVAVLGADSSKLQSEIANAKSSLKDYSKEVGNLGKESSKQASAIEKARKAIQSQANSYSGAVKQSNMLKKYIKDLQFQYEALDKSAKRSSFGKSLASTIEQAKGKLKSLEAEIDNVDASLNRKRVFGIQLPKNLSKGLSGVTQGISEQFPMLSKLGPALTNPYVMAGTAIVGAGVAVADMSSKVNDQINTIQKATGASKEMAEALRGGIEAVCDVYDTDFDSTLKSGNALMKSFAMSGEEATDLISQGLATTSLSGDEFLSQIQEYAPVLAEAGVSGQALVDIINKAAQAGIPADKAVDALKEGMLSLREMTPATAQALDGIGISSAQMQADIQSGAISSAEAMQQILAKCKEAGMGSQQVGTIMADVFRGAGEDAGLMLPILADINTQETKLSTPLNEYQQKQEDLRKATEEWENQMTSLFSTSSGGFDGIVTDIKTGCINAFIAFIKKIKECANWFIDLYNNSLYVRMGIASLKTQFQAVFGAIGMVIKTAITQIKGFAEVIKGVLTLDWDAIKKGVTTFATAGATAGKDFANNLKNNIKDNLAGINKKIPKIKIESEIEEPKNTPASPTVKGTGTGTGKGTGKGTSTTSSHKSTKTTEVKYEEGSLADLENQLSTLQDKYKKGLITLTPSDYKSQVKALEEEIESKKIELGISPDVNAEEFNKKAGELVAKSPVDVKVKIEPYKTDVSSLEDEPMTPEEITNHNISKAQEKIGENDNTINENIAKMQEYQSYINEAQNALNEFMNTHPDESTWSDEEADNVAKLTAKYQEATEAKKKLGDANDALKDTNKTLLEEANAQKKAQEEADKKKKKFEDTTDAISNMGGSLSSIGSSLGMPELDIAGTIAQAIASIVQGYATASAQAGSMGPWAWAAFSLAGLAQVASVVAQVKSLSSYASGGIISGATSIGDYNLARVNGGEMILNGTQQARLFNLLNGSGGYGESLTSGNVTFKLTGKNLTGVLKNYGKSRGR